MAGSPTSTPKGQEARTWPLLTSLALRPFDLASAAAGAAATSNARAFGEQGPREPHTPQAARHVV
jgi:hypothetical protein